MTTLTDVDLVSLTTGEAKLTIDKVINQIANGVSETLITDSDIAIIAYSVLNNLQIRDYLMGLGSAKYELREIINILNVLVDLCNSNELPAYPIETVLSAYMYQIGDSEATIMLANALDKEYPLAVLIAKIIKANWTPSSFITMSSTLHPKIIKVLDETSKLIVNENLR